MGLIHKQFIDGDVCVFGCSNCGTHLTTKDEIMSRQFQGQHGRAFLFHHVINVNEGHCLERNMTTGLHTIRELFCMSCKRILGWKYVKAFNPDQVYKEGKFILERNLMIEVSHHDQSDGSS